MHVLAIRASRRGLDTERERQIKVWYASQVVGKHCLDLVVEQAAIVELKANHGIILLRREEVAEKAE
jgi:GxxExxY protein